MSDLACVGILVADVIAREVDRLPERGTLGLLDEIVLRGGGCALNTGTVLRRLGLGVVVGGKVGADPFGDFLLRLCDERGLDRRTVLRDDAVPTSATVVLVDGDGERTFLHVPGANGALRGSELDAEALFRARALHVAGALVMPSFDGEPAAALLASARAAGLLTSLDTAFDASGRWERVLPALPHVDLLMVGLAEARGITGCSEPADAARALREIGARAVAVKVGADGCHVSSAEFQGHVPGVRVRPVDGTGAGDAFAAGLLFGLLHGWPLERAARLANAAGALATTAVGASEGVRGLAETLALAGLEEAA